jgi:hypothetical protein
MGTLSKLNMGRHGHLLFGHVPLTSWVKNVYYTMGDFIGNFCEFVRFNEELCRVKTKDLGRGHPQNKQGVLI